MEKDVSVQVRKELLDRLTVLSRASGVPVEELVDKALALYIEWKKPTKH